MDRASSRSPPRSSPVRRTTFARPTAEVPSQYRGLLEQPGLDAFDQIMIEHLGMEELYKLYTDENREVFNQPSTLQLLIRRFGLKDYYNEVRTFADLLRLYDRTYATVRTYSLIGSTPEDILEQACKEGNIQAVIKGLKLYPKLRGQRRYLRCWKLAADAGHSAIVWLFFDLLAQVPKVDYSSLSLRLAVKSGDSEILKHLLTLVKGQKDAQNSLDFYLNDTLLEAFMEAIATNQDEMIAELSKEPSLEERIRLLGRGSRNVLVGGHDLLAEGAGISGQQDKVELVFNLLKISPEEEVRYYDHVLWGAAQKDRLALAEKVVPFTSKEGRLEAFREALRHNSNQVLRYLAKTFDWNTAEWEDHISLLIRGKKDDLLWEFLEDSQGKDWTLPLGSLTEMKWRRGKDFIPLARQLLAHAAPKDLKHLRNLSAEKNEPLMQLVDELLLEA